MRFPTICIYQSHMILRVNNDYLLKQRQSFELLMVMVCAFFEARKECLRINKSCGFIRLTGTDILQWRSLY
jgi:hypothetical protein